MEEALQALFNKGYSSSEVYELGIFVALAYHLVVLVEQDVYVPLEDVS